MSASSESSRSRISTRAVIFGNPALGTYAGTVFFSDVPSQQLPSDLPLPSSASRTERLVAMMDVPPEEVPEGILNFARSHQASMEHVRVVITDEQSNNNATLEEHGQAAMKAPTGMAGRIRGTSLDLSSTDVKSVPLVRSSRAASMDDTQVSTSPTASAMESAASILAADDSPREEEKIEMSDTLCRQNLLSVAEDEQPSRFYLVLLELATQDAANEFVQDLNGQPYTTLDESVTCTVKHVIALQGRGGVSLMSPFFAPDLDTIGQSASHESGVSSSANASVGGGTASQEVHNCPVCLEHMELTEDKKQSILTTVCNHSFHLDCLLRWQDSPCPVCRYDHSGLNETLSQCHICGKTENNYVCLICGVVSCGGSVIGDQEIMALSSHARQHYDETLHAYALDTETQHVWDFAGQGYVHRLLQNETDGKLVEVSDPENTTSQQRSNHPGYLSDVQEGEVVHRKLEGFASQYYTLLKSQLEQQRTCYESRLEELRRQHERKTNATASTTDLIAALKQERNQLTQRLVSLQARRAKVTDEVAFLKSMNESLEANKEQMRRQIQDAQRERAEARNMLHQCLPPLEEKVTKLMLQLTGSTLAEQSADQNHRYET